MCVCVCWDVPTVVYTAIVPHLQSRWSRSYNARWLKRRPRDQFQWRCRADPRGSLGRCGRRGRGPWCDACYYYDSSFRSSSSSSSSMVPVSSSRGYSQWDRAQSRPPESARDPIPTRATGLRNRRPLSPHSRAFANAWRDIVR